MKTIERNTYYMRILNALGFDLNKDFFELECAEIADLTEIAEAMKVTAEDGKSRGRTLWDKAKPF